MNTEFKKEVPDLRELTTNFHDMIKWLTEHAVALEGIQYALLSALCLYGKKLKAWFSEVLTQLINRPEKSKNQRYEDFLRELLRIASNPEKILPCGGGSFTKLPFGSLKFLNTPNHIFVHFPCRFILITCFHDSN